MVLGIYYKLQTFLYLPANGFVQGMRPLIGYNYGAREHARVKKLFQLTLLMSAAIMAVGTVICQFASGQLMGLFTQNPETIAAGQTALRIISIGFVISAVSTTVSGALEGLGKGAESLVISLCRYVVFIMPLAALLCAAAPWLITGFMHLDGYMDVCDAVLSRRDLETRQRILKDSHCGAFAVICLALLVLCQWAVFLSAEALPLWALTLIPAASRACAALAVLTLRPMSTSQYSAMTRGGAPVVFAAVVLAAVCGLSVLLWDSFAPLAAAVCYWLAAWYAFRQLDGMSGDVSGFALTIAELGGAAVLVLWR